VEELKQTIFALIGKEDPQLWQRLYPLFTLRTLKANCFFEMEGEVSSKIAYLTKGITRSYFMDYAGKESVKYFNQSGSFIGSYTSVISGEPSSVFIQALTDLEFYEADFRQINALCSDFPLLHLLFRKQAELLLIKKEKREQQLLQLDAQKRYEIFLTQFPGLDQQIQQYHIASYLGISPTQLSRIRAKTKFTIAD
jgi:CRP-like cAMP-binding protein